MREYFATQDTDQLVNELKKKITAGHQYYRRKGLTEKWNRAINYYYGKFHGERNEATGSVVESGENGELATFAVNHFRNLVKHMMAMTTSQKPSFDVKAKNTDLRSIQQTRLAGNILDSYMADKKLGRHMGSAAERALVTSKGFVYMYWNPALGKPYTTQDVQMPDGSVQKKVLYEGEPDARAMSPHDVFYDVNLRDWQKRKWVIVRTHDNRWDLAARYPQVADAIKRAPDDDPLDEFSSNDYTLAEDDMHSDQIPVYEFYHEKTDAIPSGRYTKMLADGTLLYDGPCPYSRIPVFRITPGDQFDSCEGYSDSFDLMPLQEVANVLASIPFTNQQALGVQFLWLPDGCDLSETMFKGLAVLKGGPPGTEPKALQLTSTAAEVFKNQEVIEKNMEKLSGVNATVRGDPEHNLKSSVALGRMQAMAIQYASNFHKSWAELQEDCGTFLFELLRDFAKTERVAALAGKANSGAMVSFTGEDLESIDRVEVSLGNALARTPAGRIEMADKFYEKGEISAKQYMQIASTGNLDTVFESEESEIELIRKENEALMDGKPVKAIIGDHHLTHSKEHKTVMNNPVLREAAAQGDPMAIQIIQAVTAHIEEHEQLYSTQTPFFGMMSGEPPPAMPPPPPMPPGPGGPMPPPPMAGDVPPPPEPPPVPPLPPEVQ